MNIKSIFIALLLMSAVSGLNASGCEDAKEAFNIACKRLHYARESNYFEYKAGLSSASDCEIVLRERKRDIAVACERVLQQCKKDDLYDKFGIFIPLRSANYQK